MERSINIVEGVLECPVVLETDYGVVVYAAGSRVNMCVDRRLPGFTTSHESQYACDLATAIHDGKFIRYDFEAEEEGDADT